MLPGILYVLLKIKRKTAHFTEQQSLLPQLFVMRKSKQASLARKKDFELPKKTRKTTHFFSKTNVNVNKKNVKPFMIRG